MPKPQRKDRLAPPSPANPRRTAERDAWSSASAPRPAFTPYDFEEKAYPQASPELRSALRQLRPAIRQLLDADATVAEGSGRPSDAEGGRA